MPIKELEFSFKISVEALARALAESNHGMNIQVLGTETVALDAPKPPIALPAPERGMARSLIRAHMKEYDDRSFTTGDLIVYCVQFGITKEQVYAAVYNMANSGLLRKFAGNKYRLTKAGRE